MRWAGFVLKWSAGSLTLDNGASHYEDRVGVEAIISISRELSKEPNILSRATQ
jgi:hypothetical protein